MAISNSSSSLLWSLFAKLSANPPNENMAKPLAMFFKKS